MTGRKRHITYSNFLQLIIAFIFVIFWQVFHCFTALAATIFHMYIFPKIYKWLGFNKQVVRNFYK